MLCEPSSSLVERIEADDVDLAIITAGIRPRTDLLKVAGAKLRREGTVAVDARCRTSLPNIYACGVCVGVRHAVTGEDAWVPQAAAADKTAYVAGVSAAGGKAAIKSAV